MSRPLTEQELHNLAMNIVGEDLESQGFEFLSVNSKLRKDPQFVALKEGNIHFVIVRAIAHPAEASSYDPVFMQTMRKHGDKFEARTYYAGVGLGHGTDYGKPVMLDEAYTMVYDGIQEIR